MSKTPRVLNPQDIHVGLTDMFERSLTEEDVLNFAEVSGDFNPLHVDPIYAATTKYNRRIVHGAFQVAMASEWVGMYVPGLRVLLSSINAKFIAPLYYPCKVRVEGKIINWDPLRNHGSAKIVITDLLNSTPTAEIIMYVSLHELHNLKETNVVIDDQSKEIVQDTRFTGRKIILITGATGGIGKEIVSELAAQYDVICQGRDVTKLSEIADHEGVVKFQSDLDENFDLSLQKLLGERRLFGIIHAAWPSIPKGSLINLDEQIILNQIMFGSLKVISLAKLLSANVEDDGGRFIIIGSTAARLEVASTMPAYSLGKSIVEDTVRLLAPELGRKKITVNTLVPSLIPVGMNSQAQEIVLKKLASQVPLGRLCETDDVISYLTFLLSDNSAYISGQTLALTGGKR